MAPFIRNAETREVGLRKEYHRDGVCRPDLLLTGCRGRRTGACLWAQGGHLGNPGTSSVSIRAGGGIQHDRDGFHKLSDLAHH
jgi:hypothetical protein